MCTLVSMLAGATPLHTLCTSTCNTTYPPDVQAAFSALLVEVLSDFGRGQLSAVSLMAHWELMTAGSSHGECDLPGLNIVFSLHPQNTCLGALDGFMLGDLRG